MRPRKVYLIGAGPGRADLVTVRGANILKEADVVIYDYLVDEGLLENTKPGAELISCRKLGKGNGNGRSNAQDKINKLIVKKTREGKRVVRLKGGDPSTFSRIREELSELSKSRIKYEVVPGVTAASAASALAGIPLTDRNLASNCVFITGHEDPGKKESLVDWESLAKSGTIVLYMGVSDLVETTEKLIKAGRKKATPVAIVQDVSLPTQKILTGNLKNIAVRSKKCKIRPPAIIIIGEVAKLEKRFGWLKRGRRILYTGLSKERYFGDGVHFHLPLIKIKPMEDYSEFAGHIKDIKKFDWLVFASKYGVEYFFKVLESLNHDSRILAGIKIAAVGKSTAGRLRDFGITVDLLPKRETSDGLVDEFKKVDLAGKKLFMPRSDISDKGLAKAFEALGAEVTASFAYRNVMPEGLPDLDLKFFNEIMFTSPSTVRNFIKRYKSVPRNVRIKCIGGVTLKEAKRCRLLN